MCRNFSAVQEHCPPKNHLLFANCYSPLAIRYSPFAAVSPFANRHSPSFSDLPICRPHDLPISFGSAGTSPSQFTRPASYAPFRSCPMPLVPCPMSLASAWTVLKHTYVAFRGKNFTQTGVGISRVSPVGSNLPVWELIRKTTKLSLSWLAAKR
jgi:hypothetical protein